MVGNSPRRERGERGRARDEDLRQVRQVDRGLLQEQEGQCSAREQGGLHPPACEAGAHGQPHGRLQEGSAGDTPGDGQGRCVHGHQQVLRSDEAQWHDAPEAQEILVHDDEAGQVPRAVAEPRQGHGDRPSGSGPVRGHHVCLHGGGVPVPLADDGHVRARDRRLGGMRLAQDGRPSGGPEDGIKGNRGRGWRRGAFRQGMPVCVTCVPRVSGRARMEVKHDRGAALL